MKLSTALDGFILYAKASGKSPNTIELYRIYLTRMIEHLGDPEMASVSTDDIVRFYAYMQTDYKPRRVSQRDDPLSKSTVNKIWVAIRSFYNWASPKFKIPRADTEISMVEDPQEEIVPFSEEEIKRLISASQRTWCKGSNHQCEHYQRRPTRIRDYAIILFLLDTGVRAEELCRLYVSEVNLSTGDVKIRKFGSGRKTSGRTVYVETKTRQALWDYLNSRNAAHDERVFLTKENKSMDRNSLRCLLEDLGRKAGTVTANPHRFRHTFAIQYLRNGGDIFTLQRLLGHTSLKMVKRYLAIADVDSAKAHKRASPVENWL